ncbi:MAG: ABC transporter ATP-binding protein/permease [Roseburia sp.]|nr:ABC transporter ATP-binding protein/permease [Roseburia sp.]
MQKCIMSKNNGTKDRRLFLRTFSLIVKAAPRLLILVFVSELLIGLLQTGTLVAWKYAINAAEYFINERQNYLSLLLAFGISLLSYVAMDLFRMILESFYTLLNNQLSEFFQSKLYDKCKVINAIYFEDSELYNEIDRANKSIGGMISLVGTIGVLVMAVSRIATLGTYVLFTKPFLAVLVVLPIVPILITRITRGKDLYRLSYEQSENRRECDYYRKCILSKETKTLLAVPYFSEKWDILYRKINREEKKVNKKSSLLFALMNLLKYSIYIIAIIIAAMYLFDGSIDIGTFALIASMLGTTHATIEVAVSKSGDIVGSLRHAKDYFSFLDKSDDVLNEKNQFESLIKLDHVSFSYPNSDKNAIYNLDLSIRRGEKIAIVGSNGAGKTTLAKIILGLYNPTHGKILIDDKCRLDNTLIDCSTVFQSFYKYFFTLRENIAFGNLDLLDKDEELLSLLDEFDFGLVKTESSLDVQLGREFDGIELSGGEWQKIALARGFAKKSNFIILDEPNSGLDPLTESKMFQRFMQLLTNSTGIIITHRIGIAAIADRIVLLKNGQIEEEGTHEELMQKNGEYRMMFETQASMMIR